MNRIIPTTMASQHPDHASIPFWHDTEFISTRHEVKECFIAFNELGISEYKWDWEGKYVDESIVEKLYSEHFEYFKAHPLGKEKFLTFRLPNPKVETEFRLGRAFMGIFGASGLAKQLELYEQPLFEVILPMTTSAQEMMDIQEAYSELANLKHALFNKIPENLKHIELIPLFEDIDTILNSDSILETYIEMHKKTFGTTPTYLRPYIARSDPALNSGLIPTVLATKIALSRYEQFEKRHGISLHPIIGTAALPFRGGLTPTNAMAFTKEYTGIRTALIQSAFRYDYPIKDVIAGLRVLDSELPYGVAQHVSADDAAMLSDIAHVIEVPYKQTIERIAPLINTVASHLPRRRERVQHIGLFGYSRGIGGVRLPRAITFTGSLYSVGAPPEIIGTGRALKDAKTKGTLAYIEQYYLNIKDNLKAALGFVNVNALELLANESAAWKDVLDDVRGVEEYLGVQAGPTTPEQLEHAQLSQYIASHLHDMASCKDQLTTQAHLRKSLG